MKDSNNTPRKTPLFEQHQALNGKLVDFGGWSLPVNYGSQIDEHNAVRTGCGMFDVSHMTVSDLKGENVLDMLQKVLANDILKTKRISGKAIYSCMLNESGGVIDDLIAYYIDDNHCRLVTNAATNQKDMEWLNKHAQEFDVDFKERPELALIAIQGPDALELCTKVLPNDLARVTANLSRFQGGFAGEDFVGRTGYTGEDGVELIVKAELAQTLWTKFEQAGVQACGLGARDTLRLEAGMALYGNDLDEEHSPYESGLRWTVCTKSDRDFVGRKAILDKDSAKQMIGLILVDRGVLRGHQEIYIGDTRVGEVTSGTFSPSLQQSIALARVNRTLQIGDIVEIAVRSKRLKARIAKYPFVKNGEATNSDIDV